MNVFDFLPQVESFPTWTEAGAELNRSSAPLWSPVIGRAYLERGLPVIVLVRWGLGGGPRNVLIERGDGTRVVRPFRGLRRADASRN